MSEQRILCRNCRWWNDLEALGRPGRGECGGIYTQWDWRMRDDDPTEEEGAIMLDRNAILLTRATWHCANWAELIPAPHQEPDQGSAT